MATLFRRKLKVKRFAPIATDAALIGTYANAIRAALSDPIYLRKHARLDSNGVVAGIQLVGLHPDLDDATAMLIWDRNAFDGPDFKKYVYFDWAEGKSTPGAELGIIPLPDIGISAAEYREVHGKETDALNKRLLRGIALKFRGPDWTSSFILEHELAHLIHARRMTREAFGREATKDTFETARYKFVPEQYPDLWNGISFSLRAAGGDDPVSFKAKYPTPRSFINNVMEVTDHFSKKPAGSKPKAHQIRRLADLYRAILSGELAGKLVR